MPIPRPKTDENTEEFIERCMGDGKMVEEFPNEEQRYAVCKRRSEMK